MRFTSELGKIRSYCKVVLRHAARPSEKPVRDSNFQLIWNGTINLPTYGAKGVIHPDIAQGPDGDMLLAYTPYHASVTIGSTSTAGVHHENICLARGQVSKGWSTDAFENPVIHANLAVDWKSGYVADPSVLYVPSVRRWYLWSQPQCAQTKQVCIQAAWSTDGITWNECEQPVITPGTGWATFYRAPAVIYDEAKGQFAMWFDGPHRTTGFFQLGRAVSSNGIDWVLDPEPIRLQGFEQTHVWHPSVIFAHGRYWMAFVHGSMDFDEFSYLSLASSTDGTTWEPLTKAPVLAPSLLTWNGRRIYRSALFVTDRVWLLASAYDLFAVPRIGVYEVRGLPIETASAYWGGRVIPA